MNLSNEAVMDHVPSSVWNILLKIKPSFHAYSIRFFFFTVLYLFFMDVAFILSNLFVYFCLETNRIRNVGDGKQTRCTCEHDSF